MSERKRKLLIDTDAGVDDAHAILLALRNPDVDVIGITCVAGNANCQQVGLNVLRVLQVVDRLDIPVYLGCDDPVLGDKKEASEYHGTDGFGDAPDPNAPDASYLQTEHGVMALSRLSKEHEGELSLVCIGPLTNVAMAIRLDPQFGSRFKDCFIMGGNHQGKGNMSPSAEFNFYFDPEAAYVVLNQLNAPITMVTWETCEAHTLSWEWFHKFHETDTKVGRFLNSIERQIITKFYHSKSAEGLHFDYQVADQLAVAAAIYDDIIEKQVSVYATVEIKSSLTKGQLVVDWKNVTNKKANVSIALKFDSHSVKEHMQKMLH